MNEPKTFESQIGRRWPVIRRCQLAGFLVCAASTAGIMIYCAYIPSGGHEGLPDNAGFLQLASEYPTVIILRIFGVSWHWFVNNKTGGPAVFPEFVAVIVNSILGVILGSFVGKLLQFKIWLPFRR